MTEQLRKALEYIEQLSDAAQNVVAEKLQSLAEELAEQRWDELFADPRSERFFDEMQAEVERAKQEGTLRPLPPHQEGA
jgi:hypothetical protein